MKKLIYYIIMSICLISCGGDDDNEPINNQQSKINEIAAVLKGKFVGMKDDPTADLTEFKEITFSPYSAPRKEEWTEGTVTKQITMYGECDVLSYYNNHLMEVEKHWKYNIDIAYEGAQPRLYFYPDVYGVSELHYITVKSPTSFELDGITFNKQ